MEVVVSRAQMSPDFNFSCSSTALNSPYATAPSSPRPFGNPDEYLYCYASAPPSPSRASAFYSSFDAKDVEEYDARPVSPKFVKDFEFGLSLKDQKELNVADEIFDKGRIKPSKLKQPVPLPPKTPRGRERDPVPSLSASSSQKREMRSLSPFREDMGLVTEGHKAPISSTSSSNSASTAPNPFVKSSRSRKWRLKDLLLFRSASEGRATGNGSKDPLRKYTMLSSSFSRRRQQGGDQDSVKSNGSSRSLDSNSSMKRNPISAHELHYTENRAAAEEQRKRTALPFHRNSFFGCLHFNPAVRSVARGFNSYSFSQNR